MKISNYEHGTLVNDYSEFYEKGGLKEKGQYDEKGKKTGLWVRKVKSGHIIDEVEYKNGEKNGLRKTYYEDDVIDKIETFKDDELNGVTTDYSPKTRNRESEYTYVDGYMDGPFKIYYEDGKTVKAEGEYTSGNITKRRTYYPNGKLQKIEEGKGFDFKVVEQYDETGKRIK